MPSLKRYINKYRGYLIHLWMEDCIGWLVRSLPGYSGMILRWFFFRAMFKRLDSICYIYPGVYLTHTYGISAGSNLSINTGALIDGRGEITFGDYVMVGPNVVIVSSNHAHRQITVPMSQVDHEMAPVVIGNDVWIGANAVILGGVTIGDGVVVAAGAVVKDDVQAFNIVGGVPARVIGNRRDIATTE